MIAAQDTFRGFGPFLFLAGMVCVIVGFATSRELYRLLRERHPAIYDSLGRPTLFWNNSIQNGFAVLRFILGGHFKQTNDLELIRLCRFMRLFAYSRWAFFIIIVVLGFVLSAPR